MTSHYSLQINQLCVYYTGFPEFNHGEVLKEAEEYIRETGSLPSTSLSAQHYSHNLNHMHK